MAVSKLSLLIPLVVFDKKVSLGGYKKSLNLKSPLLIRFLNHKYKI